VQPVVTAAGDGLLRRFAGDGSGRDSAQQLLEILGIHEKVYLIKRWAVTENPPQP
jgi:hypothetical protein